MDGVSWAGGVHFDVQLSGFAATAGRIVPCELGGVSAAYPHRPTAEDAAEACHRDRALLPARGYFHRASPAVGDACHEAVIALIGELPDDADSVQVAQYQARYAAELCALPVCPPGLLGVELWTLAEFAREFAERVSPGGMWAAGSAAPPMTEAELAAADAALEDAEWDRYESMVRFWGRRDQLLAKDGVVPGDYACDAAAQALTAALAGAESDVNVADGEDELADDGALDDADIEEY